MHFQSTSKNTYLLLIIVIIIVLLSEVFLLNQNFYLKKKLSDFSHLKHLLSQTQQQLSHFNLLKSFEGKPLLAISSKILSPEIKYHSKSKKSTYAILFYFLQSDCASCLFVEITEWNKFHHLCEHKNCQVIGLTDTAEYGNLKSIARSLNIHFPLVHISDLKNQLNNQGITLTPITFFVDLALNKIIYANASFPYSESSSEEFVKKLHLLLDESN